MKKLTSLSLLALCAFATNAAIAATSASLTVTGTITPPSCDVTLSGNGEFALGAISLASAGQTHPSPVSQTMSISCTGPSVVGFRLTDNRASTRTLLNVYGLGIGLDSASNPIGYYLLTFGSLQVNGSAGFVKMSEDNGATWGAWAGDAMTPYAQLPRSYAFGTTSGATPPSPMTTASAVLSANVYIEPRNTLDLSNVINLDGSATIDLVYL